MPEIPTYPEAVALSESDCLVVETAAGTRKVKVSNLRPSGQGIIAISKVSDQAVSGLVEGTPGPFGGLFFSDITP